MADTQKMRTLPNPDGETYRMPLHKLGDFAKKTQLGIEFLFGDAINELGAYEAIGTIEEFRELKARWGTKNSTSVCRQMCPICFWCIP